MYIHAERALLPDGWATGLRIAVEGNQIKGVVAKVAPSPGDLRVEILTPGLPNLHSHAFQRGFSGLTETRGPGRDNFWSWREMMYRFALSVLPEDVEALTAFAYIEMLEAGFTRVGEFHYLHHAPDGRPYDDPAEMSVRVAAAAEATGISLTHLPVFYAFGGFGRQPAGEGQRRFLHDLDGFVRLMERCAVIITRPQDKLGFAPHSLRAASLDQLAELWTTFPNRLFHIHVAEQVKEVEDSLAHTGARPVEWLLANAPVGPDWCLIHATHLTLAEVAGIAGSQAVVGLCPITEANLGDGVFPAEAFLAQGGRWGVGTDSNVEITAAGELRMLEYSQRLVTRTRNVCAGDGSTGGRLFRDSLLGGAQALGAPAPGLVVGAPADLVALRDAHCFEMTDDRLLDRWVFGRDLAVSEVWAAGRHVVTGGRHVDRDRIEAAYQRAMAPLLP